MSVLSGTSGKNLLLAGLLSLAIAQCWDSRPPHGLEKRFSASSSKLRVSRSNSMYHYVPTLWESTFVPKHQTCEDARLCQAEPSGSNQQHRAFCARDDDNHKAAKVFPKIPLAWELVGALGFSNTDT